MKIKFYVKSVGKNVAGADVTIFDGDSCPVMDFNTTNRYRSIDLEPSHYLFSITAPQGYNTINPFIVQIKQDGALNLDDADSYIELDDDSITVNLTAEDSASDGGADPADLVEPTGTVEPVDTDPIDPADPVESTDDVESTAETSIDNVDTAASDTMKDNTCKPIEVEEKQIEVDENTPTVPSPATKDVDVDTSSIIIPKSKPILLRFGKKVQKFVGVLNVESTHGQYAQVKIKAPGSGRVVRCNVLISELDEYM